MTVRHTSTGEIKTIRTEDHVGGEWRPIDAVVYMMNNTTTVPYWNNCSFQQVRNNAAL